jgi:hypothetical protein
MKLRPGQTCAACVAYADSGSRSWILTKVDKKASGSRYIVRDEYADDEQYETYVVEANKIAPFPTPNEEYKVGDRVLALWRDEESNEWSTMFYPADVVAINSHVVTLLYKGSESKITVDDTKITKFPEGYDFASDNEEPSADESSGPSDTAQSTELVEPVTEQKLPNPSSPTNKTTGSSQTNTEDETAEPHTQVRKIHPEIAAMEKRRLTLMFNKPNQTERPMIQPLSNEDFTSLAGPVKEREPMRTEPGTPLLDYLNDPDLFVQEHFAHVAGSGVISVHICGGKGKSALLSGPVKCGRLGLIFNEWNK